MYSPILALHKLLGLIRKVIHRRWLEIPLPWFRMPVSEPRAEPVVLLFQTTLTIISMAVNDYSNTIIWIGEDASGTKEDPEPRLMRFLDALAPAPGVSGQPMIRIVIQPGVYVRTEAFAMVNRILGGITGYPWHRIGVEFPSDLNPPRGVLLLLAAPDQAPIDLPIPSLQHLDLKGHLGMSFPWYPLSDIPFQQLLSLKLSLPMALRDCTAILSQAPNLLDAEFHGTEAESELKQIHLSPRLGFTRLTLTSTVDVQPLLFPSRDKEYHTNRLMAAMERALGDPSMGQDGAQCGQWLP